MAWHYKWEACLWVGAGTPGCTYRKQKTEKKEGVTIEEMKKVHWGLWYHNYGTRRLERMRRRVTEGEPS